MLDKEVKAQLVKDFGRSENDTGSVETQVAILTTDIQSLQSHFASNKKDEHSKRGLFGKINLRKKLLAYLRRKDMGRYKVLIERLKLRG